MKSFLNSVKEKLDSLLSKEKENFPPEEPSRDETIHGSNHELHIWSANIKDTSVEIIKEFYDSEKFKYLTRKYDSSRETLKKFVELEKEIEKEIAVIAPKTLKTKVADKMKSGVSKVKSLFSRKPKQIETKTEKK
jgi:acylphosphatase